MHTLNKPFSVLFLLFLFFTLSLRSQNDAEKARRYFESVFHPLTRNYSSHIIWEDDSIFSSSTEYIYTKDSLLEDLSKKRYFRFERITWSKQLQLRFVNIDSSQTLSFWQNIFLGDVLVMNSEFNSRISFSNSEFFSNIKVYESGFNKGISYFNCIFHKPFSLYDYSVWNDILVHEERAARNLDYDEDVGSPLRFSTYSYRDSLEFKNSHFYQGADINLGNLRYLSLEGVKTEEPIGISTALSGKAGRYCRINLYNAPLEDIYFSYRGFKLAIPKIRNEANFEKANALYERLLTLFKERGQISSYELLDKEHQDFKLNMNPSSNFGDKILYHVNLYWNDFGYAKERIWLWTISLFLFFWIINWLKFSALYYSAYCTASLHKVIEERNLKSSFKKPSVSTIDLSLYYTAMIFLGLKIDSKNFNYQNLAGVIYIGFQYVVGLVCLGYIANFVITSGAIGI
ncbi:hypothetical protein [Roseivirga pacifica]|uniref:hypothetical protein n=1 Tax=Roseivirga pacifica TaxID=1267423 RepID=UPI00227CFFE9|nr:hypothetical protein [Roseivirga pacifica]